MTQTRQFISQIIPGFLKNKMRDSGDIKKFNSLEKATCVTNNLRSIKDISLPEIFNSGEISNYWEQSKREIDTFNLPDGTGGVNPGDRRALYYLISKFQPSSLLEIGTHIGASTVHIASAFFISQVRKGRDVKLTTLDIRDVNSTVDKPWLEFGTKYSPIEMIKQLNYGAFVNFKTDTSVNYFSHSNDKYDFIFLDGDHSATTVYQEVPGALKMLNPNGVILLHDYFPNLKPLWSNGSVLKGPVMAIDRLIKEGADLTVLPLGKLPWPTKLNSNVTSLALLLRNS